jgi:hypothetical protein
MTCESVKGGIIKANLGNNTTVVNQKPQSENELWKNTKEIPLGGAKTYKGFYLLAKTIQENTPVFVTWVDEELKWFVHDLSGYFIDKSLYHFQFPQNDINLNFDYSKCKEFIKTNEVKGYADRKNISKAYMVNQNEKNNEEFLTQKQEVKDTIKDSLKQAIDQVTHEIVKKSVLNFGSNDTLYKPLQDVLNQAFDQAATGKGKERHGNGKEFTQQPMFQIADMLGSNHFMIGQAIKKAQESTRMDKDRAIKELLGSIVYLCGAILYLENN